MDYSDFSRLLDGLLNGTIHVDEVVDMMLYRSHSPPEPITWDEAENRKYEYGVSKVILFLKNEDGTYTKGIPWTGVTNIKDQPEGVDLTKLWADGIEYGGVRNGETYKGSIEAYTYPDEFGLCDGSAQPISGMHVGQQQRRRFGLCWRTEIGNANTENLGYKIHIAYGLIATPSEKSYDSINDSIEIDPFLWNIEGSPVTVRGFKPTVKMEFDSTILSAARMRSLEDLFYGDAGSMLFSPDDLFNILEIAYGPEVIGRQQITGEIDYVKNGVLYRGANASSVLIHSESELNDLAFFYKPGSFAFNQDMTMMWQLNAGNYWIRII